MKIFVSIILAVLAHFVAVSMSFSEFLAQASSVKNAKTDVVILGAGLSGLSAGYFLKKEKIDYKILEISPRVGGRVRTSKYQIDGHEYLVDSGMEEYWESNPGVAILKELNLPVISDVAASSVVLDQKIVPFSASDTNESYLKRLLTVDGLSQYRLFLETIRPLWDEIKNKKISSTTMALKEVSFAQYVRSQKTITMDQVRQWVRISIECEVGTSWDRISALDGIAEMHIFIENEKGLRVVGGNERFTQALHEHVGKDNVLLNKRVTRVVRDKDSARVYFTDLVTNENSVIEAKEVISTIPLYKLFELQFDPPLSEAKQKAIQSQSWGAYFKVHAFFKNKAQKFWAHENDTILPILSDSNLGVIYDGLGTLEANAKPLSVLSLLIFGDEAEAFNLMSLDQVRERVLLAFEKIFPGIKKNFHSIEFYRFHPRAIASWPVGRSRFDSLSEEIRKPEMRLHLAGDFTETSHSDGAFISARRSVDQIILSRRKTK